MLTRQEQYLLLHIDEGKNTTEELKAFYYNDVSLYRSAKRLKDYDLVFYHDGRFSFTIKGKLMSDILFYCNKIDCAKTGGMKHDK